MRVSESSPFSKPAIDRPALLVGMQVAVVLRALEIVEETAAQAGDPAALEDAHAGLAMIERFAARTRARLDRLRAPS